MESANNFIIVDKEQLYNYTFSIKDYQREYVWTNDNVDDLLVSMHDNLFFGVGTFTVQDNNIEIIDGQQRLLTIALIFGNHQRTKKQKIDFNLTNVVGMDINKIINWSIDEDINLSKGYSSYAKKLLSLKYEAISRKSDLIWIYKKLKALFNLINQDEYTENIIQDLNSNISNSKISFSNDHWCKITGLIANINNRSNQYSVEVRAIEDRLEKTMKCWTVTENTDFIKMPFYNIGESDVNKSFVAMNSKGSEIQNYVYFKQLIIEMSEDNIASINNIWTNILHTYYSIKEVSSEVSLSDLITQAHDSICKGQNKPLLSLGKILNKYKKSYKRPQGWEYGEHHLSEISDHLVWAKNNLIIDFDSHSFESPLDNPHKYLINKFDGTVFSPYIPLIYYLNRYLSDGDITHDHNDKKILKVATLQLHLCVINFISTYIKNDHMPALGMYTLMDKYLLENKDWINTDDYERGKLSISSFIKDSMETIMSIEEKSYRASNSIFNMRYKYTKIKKVGIDKNKYVTGDFAKLTLTIFNLVEVFASGDGQKLCYKSYKRLIDKVWRTPSTNIEHIFNESEGYNLSGCIIIPSKLNTKLGNKNLKEKQAILLKERNNFNKSDKVLIDAYLNRIKFIDDHDLSKYNKREIQNMYKHHLDNIFKEGIKKMIMSKEKY